MSLRVREREVGNCSSTAPRKLLHRAGIADLDKATSGGFQNWGVPVLGAPLRGFYSIWSITGISLFWEIPTSRLQAETDFGGRAGPKIGKLGLRPKIGKLGL